jgi:hypothetical protein
MKNLNKIIGVFIDQGDAPEIIKEYTLRNILANTGRVRPNKIFPFISSYAVRTPEDPKDYFEASESLKS